METKTQSVINCSMMGGFVLGLSVVGCLSMTMLFPSFSLLMIIMLPVIYYRCIMRSTMIYKETALEGDITFGKAYSVGMYVSFFASTIVAVAVCVYCKWLDPEGFSEMVRASVKMWESYAKTPEQMEIVKQMSQTTATDMTFSSIWSFSIFGFVVSLITSFVSVRKK